jgi:hypothetical protein
MSWECLNCGMPNFSTALFNSKYSIESDNHLSYLSKNSILSSPINSFEIANKSPP